MDCLRYWVTEMDVDGFRFDLAATLARSVPRGGPAVLVPRPWSQQDPVVRRVKLIAEPWDVGEGGYQVGTFPPLWTEWNGTLPGRVRDLARGAPRTLAELAYAAVRLLRPVPWTAGAARSPRSTS
ncbi:glycogen debranching protein GlgX [Streptomyces tanashiensis]